MADLNNPADALTRGKQLLGLLGTFWVSLYSGADTIAAYTNAKNQAELQSYRDLMEVVACTSRFSIPIYHRANWSILTVRQSQQLPGRLLTFGSGAVYGNSPGNLGNTYFYGVSPDRTTDFPPPNKLKDVSVIVNRITEPSVTLVKDIDFLVDTSVPSIRFKDNPFNNPLIPTVPIYDQSGKQVDLELSLWLFMGDYDWGFIYEQFGYALGLYLDSSNNYRNLLNAVWDAVLQGSSTAHLRTILACMTDAALTLESTETVVDITTETDRKLIITDQHVYTFSLTATPVVTIGQVLTAGSRLVDSFKIYYPHSDVLPVSDVPSLEMTTSMLLGSFQGSLVFANQVQPLTVTTDINGKTRVSFPLTGNASDIQLFWDQVHTNGTAPGAVSLAKLLDLRAPPVQSTEPQAANLPTTINPVDFLAKNVLRNNAIIVIFNTASFGPNALGTSYLQPLRQIMPPQAAIFFLTRTS